MSFSDTKIQQIIREKLSLKVSSITENIIGWDQDVWIIDTNDQKIVLKHPRKNNKVRNSREVIASKLLAQKGVIVPQILYSDDQILIETFLEGILVEQVDFTKISRNDLYFNAGKVLKKIHSITTTNFGMVTDDSLVGEFSTQVEYTQVGFSKALINLEKTPFYTHDDIRQIRQYFESNKSVLENSPSVLLHADYCDTNLIYTPDGEIAVIDFGDLSVGNPMYDVSMVYLDCVDDGSYQACIDGYGETNLKQVELFGLCRFTYLISAWWNKGDPQKRVERLCRLFESICR